MEDQNTKIANLQLIISENCSEREKEIIKFYWELKDNNFVNTPSQVKNTFGISQSEMRSITKLSTLSFYKYCNNCDSYENLEATSITNFFEINPIKLKRHQTYEAFKCKHCESLELEKRWLEKKEAKKKLFQKFAEAIDLKNWNNLNRFEREVLCNCLEMTFSQLGKKYGDQNGKEFYIKMIKALEKIAEENLLFLVRDPRRNNYISDYQYLPRLTEFKDEIKPPKSVSSSYVETNNETNELKFKLTINENQYHPDSPLHAGTVTFKERIVIEPGVEYIFGLWNRANENLYLTMVPLENLENIAQTKRISKQPISLQQGIKDFLKDLGKNFNL